ncbi:hypothetical protein CL628_03655 [bacterium]|nr:hypothetical protein [bacterium]|tara:strand:+ start:736 stop:1191 length:456 start_codon:yes stop_codon:yes gene_type:complete
MTTLYAPVMSVHEAQAATRRLQQAGKTLHQAHGKPASRLASVLTEVEYQQLKTQLGDSLDSMKPLEQALNGALAELEKRPRVLLELAFEPTHTFIAELKAWLTKHGPTPCLLELKMNPGVVGGVIVGWHGKRFDYSVGAKLNTYDEFPEVS